MEISTFQKRKSVRRFSDKEIEESTLKEMIEFGKNLPPVFQKPEHQLFWIYSKTAISNLLSKFLLSYGKLVSAPYIIAPFYKREANADLEIGFMLEFLVLKATELGLGTLWLSTDGFGEAMKNELVKMIKENTEILRVVSNNIPVDLDSALTDLEIPVVVLLGHASEKRIDRILNNAIRMESAGNSRKKIESIITNRRNDALPEKLKKVLNHAILAPSKKNQQPWRVRLGQNGFDVGYLHDRKLDIGIFLSHIKISLDNYKISYQMNPLEECNNDISWVVNIKWK